VTNERKIRLEDGELVNSDMEGMIGTFETIANHPLSRILLEKTMNYCQKDEANSIEVGLQLMLGQRENACLKMHHIIQDHISPGKKRNCKLRSFRIRVQADNGRSLLGKGFKQCT
jgi:hypothetical protein